MLKKSSIEAYNTNHKYDFIFFSETYLDSTVAANDKNLFNGGCTLVRADHPSNLEKGGICIYYKELLAFN